MDTLLQPDKGLLIWTVVSFLVLVGLLRAFAWGPLLAAVDAREARLREERERAEAARQEAERIRGELSARLAGAEGEMREILAKAGREAEAIRTSAHRAGEEESKRILTRARRELEEEKQRLMGELRREVSSLSVLAAERLLRRSVDPGVQKDVLERFFREAETR